MAEILKPYTNEALRYAAADTSVGTADLIERDQAGMRRAHRREGRAN
jgi:hypothetical protein